MKKGVFICFIGIDGSGKTTLSKIIVEDLKKQGLSAHYTWCKFESSLLRLIIFFKNMLLVREKNLGKNYEKSLGIKRTLFNNRLISCLFEYFVLIDYTLQVCLKIAIPLNLGTNIICDRYIYDTVVDLAKDLEYSDKKIQYRLNQLLRLLPSPDILFFIDVPEEVSLKRKNDIPSLEFLRTKKENYYKISFFLKQSGNIIQIMDGTRSLYNLRKETISLIDKYIEDA